MDRKCKILKSIHSKFISTVINHRFHCLTLTIYPVTGRTTLSTFVSRNFDCAKSDKRLKLNTLFGFCKQAEPFYLS